MTAPLPIEHELLAHTEWMRALARGLVRDAHAADDLVQEACVVALERPPRSLPHPRAWLATVLRSLARQRERAESRRAERERRARAERGEARDEEAVLERARAHRALVDAVLALDDPFRTALLLRYFEGLGPRAIAERLDVPLDTVRSRLRRALARLREKLERESGGERATWLGALAPLLADARPAAPGTALAALAISTKVAVAAGAVVALALAAATWLVWPGGPAPPSAPLGPVAVPAAPPRDARVEAEPAVGARAEAGERAPAAAPDAPTPAAAAEDARTATVRGVVLLAGGAPAGAVALAFVPSSGAPQPFASDADGHFEAVVARAAGAVHDDDERLATLLAGDVVPELERELVVVVALARVVAGRVVDPAGRPLAGARVAWRVPRDVQREIGRVLDASREVEHRARAADDGSFALGAVPALPDARLVTTHPGYADDERAVGGVDEARVLVVLAPLVAVEGEVAGVVVDADGRPVAGARVAAGATIVRTDALGHFVLDASALDGVDELVAAHPGARPGVATRDGAAWPPFVRLQLGPPALALAGRVVDGRGAPRAGVRVWLADPTVLGVEGESPAVLESVLAGARAKAAVEEAGESLAATPNALWSWSTTDADGAFRLEGLLARDYVVRALDEGTLALAETAPHAAGGPALEIELARGGIVLAGRVVTSAGDPVAGAAVRATRRAFRVRPSGERTVSWDVDGPEATADIDGRFELGPVAFSSAAPDELALLVRGPRVSGARVPLADAGAPAELEIVLEPRADAGRGHVQVIVADPERVDAFELRDATGAPVPLVLRRGGYARGLERAEVALGRSLVLSAPSGDWDLVLLRAGVALERIALALAPDELVTVRR